MSLVLHYHPLSSFCWKVLIGLYELEVPFEPRTVELGDPQAREAYARLWPTAKIPLLEDTGRGRIVPETSIMLEYVERHYAGGRRLLPQDPEQRLDARLWDRLFDQYVMAPQGRVVMAHFRGDAEAGAAERAGMRNAYPMIEARLAECEAAGRQWIAGDDFSLADCAAAPALFYTTIMAPPGGEFPLVEAYLQRLMARPSVIRAVDGARPVFHMFPFHDELPEEYRPA